MHSNNLNELPVLSLQESYSLSVLMYFIPAMSLSAKQTSVKCRNWTSVMRDLLIDNVQYGQYFTDSSRIRC